MSRILAPLCAALLLLPLGCGERTYKVSGIVTFDGKPVDTGTIAFEAADGGPGVATSGIQAGKYELQSKTGKKKVMITAYRARPGTENDPQPPSEEYVPAKYNRDTELTKEVTAGDNRFDFDLKK